MHVCLGVCTLRAAVSADELEINAVNLLVG